MMNPTMMKRSVPGLLIGALFLSGCAVQMPDMKTVAEEASPAAWSVSIYTQSSADPAEFWQSWGDPKLVALIEKARNANTDVLTALASLRSARAGLSDARHSLFPSASIGADGTHRHANGGSSESFSAAADVKWSWNLAGADLSNETARRYEALASEISVADAQALAEAQTAQAYITLRPPQALLKVAEETVKNYEESAEIASWRASSGLSSASEAEDALSQVASAKARIPQLRATEASYRNALARLTTMPVDKLDLGIGPVPQAPVRLTVSIPAETLMKRPDIRSAQASLLSAGSDLKTARENYFPTLSLSGSVGTQAATLGALGASGTGIASLVGALSMPVLNWGSLAAQEERAAASLDKAKANYLSVIVKALEETDNALNGIRSAQDRTDLLQAALKHTEKTYELTELEYRSGIGDYSMLLQAQQRFLTLRESVTNNLAELSLQHVKLYRALGGAWTVQERAR